MTTKNIKADGTFRTIVLGVFSYMGTLCFIPLMVRDRNAFVLFHARQGLVLWGWSVLAVFSLLLPGIGTSIFGISLIVVIGLSITGVLSVALQKTWKLPLVYKLSQAI